MTHNVIVKIKYTTQTKLELQHKLKTNLNSPGGRFGIGKRPSPSGGDRFCPISGVLAPLRGSGVGVVGGLSSPPLLIPSSELLLLQCWSGGGSKGRGEVLGPGG